MPRAKDNSRDIATKSALIFVMHEIPEACTRKRRAGEIQALLKLMILMNRAWCVWPTSLWDLVHHNIKALFVAMSREYPSRAALLLS